METFFLDLWNSFVSFLPKLVAAIIILLVGLIIKWLLMRLLRRFLKKKAQPLMDMFVTNSVNILIWVFVLLSVMGALGLNTTSIITALGAAGLAIGLALQGSLSNIASGLLLLGSKVFKGGDYVTINGIEGTVVSTDLMFTHLNSVDNKHIAVPNSGITANNITNYTFNDLRRVDMEFTAGYKEDMARIKQTLAKVCSSTDGVLPDPKFSIHIKSYDASTVRILVRLWCKRDDYWNIYFAVTESTKQAFDSQGITIPYQQVDVHFFPPVNPEH